MIPMKTCIRCTTLLLLLLALTGCAAAAPKFDLSAGEIAAGEGLTLHMPASDLPAPWTAEEEPGKWEAALPYAGIAFDARARADEEGMLKQVTLSAADDGSWAQADVDALVQAGLNPEKRGFGKGVLSLPYRYYHSVRRTWKDRSK